MASLDVPSDILLPSWPPKPSSDSRADSKVSLVSEEIVHLSDDLQALIWWDNNAMMSGIVSSPELAILDEVVTCTMQEPFQCLVVESFWDVRRTEELTYLH